MGNWEADILSREKLEYAATDAFASWYLYEVKLANKENCALLLFYHNQLSLFHKKKKKNREFLSRRLSLSIFVIRC